MSRILVMLDSLSAPPAGEVFIGTRTMSCSVLHVNVMWDVRMDAIFYSQEPSISLWRLADVSSTPAIGEIEPVIIFDTILMMIHSNHTPLGSHQGILRSIMGIQPLYEHDFD